MQDHSHVKGDKHHCNTGRTCYGSSAPTDQENTVHTTITLIDAVKAKLCIRSDNALAVLWGISRQRIYQYRRGTTAFSDEKAIEIADLLGLDRAEILLSIQAERAAKQHLNAVADTLADAVRRLSGIAAAIFLSFALPFPAETHAESPAFTRPAFDNNTNYAPLARLKALRRLWLWFAVRLFAAPFAPIRCV